MKKSSKFTAATVIAGSYPTVTVDSKNPGTVGWTNRVNAATSNGTFPGGHTVLWSPYQQVNWTVYSSQGFYNAPSSVCN